MYILDDRAKTLLYVFSLSCRVEDEAVLDRGASFVKHICDEEEVEGELGNKYWHELSKRPRH